MVQALSLLLGTAALWAPVKSVPSAGGYTIIIVERQSNSSRGGESGWHLDVHSKSYITNFIV
jgi:hypothetical protein